MKKNVRKTRVLFAVVLAAVAVMLPIAAPCTTLEAGRAANWIQSTETAIYFSDFESDNGSMTGTLDWGWGEYVWDNESCDGNAYPPPTAYSGSQMWGTVLNSCYGNLNDTSILSFDIDLSTAATAMLSWWDWYDVFESFDFGAVYVNDIQVYDRETTYVIPTAWEQHLVDLMPYVGGVATIQFRMYASTVVNRSGWFIDDVMVVASAVSPNIDVTPQTLSSIQPANTITQQTLDISNTGEANLEWELFEAAATAAASVQQQAASLEGNADLEWEILQELAAVKMNAPVLPLLAPIDSAAVLAEEMAGMEFTEAALPAQESLKVEGPAKPASLSTGLLLIPDSTNDRIMALDPVSGDVLEADFVPSESAVGTGVHAILNAAGDRILLSDQLNDVVHEFDLDGNYIGIFAPAGGADTSIMDNIRGMSLRPNGNLLVTVGSGDNDNAVVEFDTSGNYLGNFISSGSGGLGSPFDICGRSSDWLVGGIDSDAIHRYDLTGSYLGDLATIDSFPEQIFEASSGNILVANFSGTQEGVVEYTAAGALVGVYNPASLGGYRGVYELPNGNILTTTASGVYEIDRSGNLVETKISGISARFIQYVSGSACTDPADVPWLSVDTDNGTTAPGDNATVVVGFDSSGLAVGTYNANLCIVSNDPDNGTGNGTGLVVVAVSLDVVGCVDAGDCPDDGLFCTGVPVCDNGTCGFAGDPCADDNQTPVCDEENDTCISDCELIVKHKKIRSDKLTKPRKVILTVTSSDELFDVFGQIDLEPFTWDRVRFHQQKNRIKIRARVPAGLAPGVYLISVGGCFGEVVVE